MIDDDDLRKTRIAWQTACRNSMPMRSCGKLRVRFQL
jgi:hypothetical protein